MSEQTFFIGDEYNGNKIEQGICPCCGSINLSYDAINIVDDNVNRPWKCDDCGSNGSEWHSLEFSGHNIKENNKIGKDMGEDTVECIVDVYLMGMFTTLAMDKPENYDQLLEFVCEDIKECADENFSYGDIVIAFRRFIEK
jgi:hypothetical protein